MATAQAALEVQDTKIADELINNILQVSYQGLSAKLKKVSTQRECSGELVCYRPSTRLKTVYLYSL